MRRAIRDFTAKVAESGPDTVALVYYAGHGLQIDGENYLVPVDANIRREADIPIEAIRLHDVMNILDGVGKTRIVILDACRNNPFSAINRTIGKGLAIVDAPKGTIVSYSTSPGATAADGAGDHSPFTAALIDLARKPDVLIEQTFKSVRIAVHRTTQGQQTPWESSSLTANFAFFPGADAPPETDDKVQAKTAADWKRVIEKRPPAEAFELLLGADVVEAYEAFVDVFPLPPFGPRVRGLLSRRQEMIAWSLAVTLNSVASFQTFLASYPNSDLAATARRLLDRAKNRSLALGPGRSIAGNSAANNASAQVKVVKKIVEVPKIVQKIVEVPVVKIVEKPVVKVVEKVVKVRYCPEPKRRKQRTRRRHFDDDDEPVFVGPRGPTIQNDPGFAIPFGPRRRRGHRD